jgi:hypothetical protein
MAAPLFDQQLRAMRRARAARGGAETFLHERAFADCLERIALVQRRFASALLIGCADETWPGRLEAFAERVEILPQLEERRWPFPESGFHLCLAIGELDTINDLPAALLAIRSSLNADALFIGALSGGNTLPQLRNAMRAADAAEGVAVPHVHPRIEASALAPLLSAAGFRNAVVDVDRVRVSYPSLDRLVADLRAMGATNILSARSRGPVSRAGRSAAAVAFAAAARDGRTEETFEILHFATWTPPPQQG